MFKSSEIFFVFCFLSEIKTAAHPKCATQKNTSFPVIFEQFRGIFDNMNDGGKDNYLKKYFKGNKNSFSFDKWEKAINDLGYWYKNHFEKVNEPARIAYITYTDSELLIEKLPKQTADLNDLVEMVKAAANINIFNIVETILQGRKEVLEMGEEITKTFRDNKTELIKAFSKKFGETEGKTNCLETFIALPEQLETSLNRWPSEELSITTRNFLNLENHDMLIDFLEDKLKTQLYADKLAAAELETKKITAAKLASEKLAPVKLDAEKLAAENHQKPTLIPFSEHKKPVNKTPPSTTFSPLTRKQNIIIFSSVIGTVVVIIFFMVLWMFISEK